MKFVLSQTSIEVCYYLSSYEKTCEIKTLRMVEYIRSLSEIFAMVVFGRRNHSQGFQPLRRLSNNFKIVKQFIWKTKASLA
jgi:hypothetical protein